MKSIAASVVFSVVLSVACDVFADTVLWYRFDERAPGETAQATDVLANAVSTAYGNGQAWSIDEGATKGSDLYSLGLDGLGKFGEHAVKFLGERGRIAARCLLHRKNDGLVSVERRAAAAGLAGDRYVRNVAEPERAAVFKWDGGQSQGGQGVGARDLPQGHLLAADVRQIACA